MHKLLILVLSLIIANVCYADSSSRNQGAVNNLCQNLAAACKVGDRPSCDAARSTGCICIESQGTCTRGNYIN